MTVKNNITLIRGALYLLEAVKNGQLAKTAEENGIKLSNLSKLIKDLEVDLDTQLLVRNHKGVQATPDGKVLISHAEVLQNALEKIQEITERNIKEVKIFIKEGFVINLLQISTDIKIVQTKDINDCDIALNDSFSSDKEFNCIPIKINQGIISTNLSLFYINTLINQKICKQIACNLSL